MSLLERLISASKAAGFHALGSAAVALGCLTLVFGLWYPPPFDILAAGRQLIFLILAVDVICGPLLTFIVFSPRKSPSELRRDIGVVVFLQFLALGYGLYSIVEARPVWLAFEGDRFRIVSVPDISKELLSQAPQGLRKLSLTGPRLLGVRLAKPNEPEFLSSIQLAMQGIPPAFRPARWVPYENQIPEVIAASKPLKNLYEKYPEKKDLLDKKIKETGFNPDQLGYFPLVSENSNEWAIFVGLNDALPKAYFPVDAW